MRDTLGGFGAEQLHDVAESLDVSFTLRAEMMNLGEQFMLPGLKSRKQSRLAVFLNVFHPLRLLLLKVRQIRDLPNCGQ